jgi:pimeloyl-ACP methyl ester carboxylesterase
VLLHGLSNRWQGWSQEIGLLSHRWQVFALDARGHGKSGRAPDGDYNMDTQVNDAARFIEDLIGAPAVVIGHSLGALTSIGLAGKYPDLIRAAVLEDPPAFIINRLDQTDFCSPFVTAQERMRSGI